MTAFVAARPPPRHAGSRLRAIAWLRGNLFSTPLNALDGSFSPGS